MTIHIRRRIFDSILFSGHSQELGRKDIQMDRSMVPRKPTEAKDGSLLSRAHEAIARYTATIRAQEEIIKKLQKENEQLRDQIANHRRQLQATEPGGISAAVNKPGGTHAVSPTKQV